MNEVALTHEFVEFIPEDLKENTIYVSTAYATVVHKCCCGCGSKVVTPLSPTDWKLIFDGRSISLDPSIGNWNFTCQSHYWIKRNRVKLARKWTHEKIAAGRKCDSLAKARFFENGKETAINDPLEQVELTERCKSKKSFWQKMRGWLH